MLPAERSSMKVYMFICINYTKTKKTAVVAHTFKIWEAAGFSAVKAQKKKKLKAFAWAKNTARGVHFLLRFNTYLFFFLNCFFSRFEQVCLFSALAIKQTCSYQNTRGNETEP